MTSEVYRRAYNSLSGVDMAVYMDGVQIADVQGLSYTVTREKAPIYTMGSADPRSFSRGKRGIAGSMIFIIHDRSPLLSSLRRANRYLANDYEVDLRAQEKLLSIDQEAVFGVGAEPTTVGTSNAADPRLTPTITADKAIATPKYHDQIMPFDIVIGAANEYGHIAKMEILNAEIMNCGSGVSIDDINTDESCTWVATSMLTWHTQQYINPKDGQTAVLQTKSGSDQVYPTAGRTV